MEQQQLTHHHIAFTPKQHPITLVCDQLTGAANIGSIFRLADAFGVQKIYFLQSEFEFNRRTEKTSRSTHKYVAYEFIPTLEQLPFIKNLKEGNTIALEITNTSKAIQKLNIQPELPTYLFIGNENYGVSASALNVVEQSYHIPMFGKNSSMNIAQATSIALYELTNLYQEYAP